MNSYFDEGFKTFVTMLWLKTEVAIVLLFFFICYTGSDPRASLSRRRSSSRRRSGCTPIPCVAGPWSEWSACGTECQVQTATREEITSAKCGGPCTLEEWRWCGQMTCFNGGSLEDEKCVCKKGYSGYCCEGEAAKGNVAVTLQVILILQDIQ